MLRPRAWAAASSSSPPRTSWPPARTSPRTPRRRRPRRSWPGSWPSKAARTASASNIVNPDAVFQDSGLWSERSGASGRAAQGIPVDELEDFYRQRNLLGAPILPEDVAEAALFFASDRWAKTTGCISRWTAASAKPSRGRPDEAWLRFSRSTRRWSGSRSPGAPELGLRLAVDRRPRVSVHGPIFRSLTLLAAYTRDHHTHQAGSGSRLLALRGPDEIVAEISVHARRALLRADGSVFGVQDEQSRTRRIRGLRRFPHAERGGRGRRGRRHGADALGRDTPASVQGPASHEFTERGAWISEPVQRPGAADLGGRSAPTPERWSVPGTRATSWLSFLVQPGRTPRAWPRSTRRPSRRAARLRRLRGRPPHVHTVGRNESAETDLDRGSSRGATRRTSAARRQAGVIGGPEQCAEQLDPLRARGAAAAS